MAFLTKLWTNNDPTAAFAAQTVALDLSSYEAVLITVRAGRTDGTYASQLCFKNEEYQVTINSKVVSSENINSRAAKITSSGIEFTTGYQGSTSGTNYSIPIYIFGVHIE